MQLASQSLAGPFPWLCSTCLSFERSHSLCGRLKFLISFIFLLIRTIRCTFDSIYLAISLYFECTWNVYWHSNRICYFTNLYSSSLCSRPALVQRSAILVKIKTEEGEERQKHENQREIWNTKYDINNKMQSIKCSAVLSRRKTPRNKSSDCALFSSLANGMWKRESYRERISFPSDASDPRSSSPRVRFFYPKQTSIRMQLIFQILHICYCVPHSHRIHTQFKALPHKNNQTRTQIQLHHELEQHTSLKWKMKNSTSFYL